MQPLCKFGPGEDFISTIEARDIIDTPQSRLAAMHARLRRRRFALVLLATLIGLGVVSALVPLPGPVWLYAGALATGLLVVFYPAP